MNLLRLIGVGAICAVLSFFTLTARAQAWPDGQAIKIIGGFPTGAGTDVFARLLAQPLSEALGQSIVVDNRSGAGGNVGSEFVARAAPDGYTFLLGTAGTHAINATLYAKLSFDVVRDFEHVALLVDVPNVLIINPEILPDVKNCADLLKRASSGQKKLIYASTGNGASSHLAGAQFVDASGVEMRHVPYRGTPPAMNAMASGEAQVMFQQSIPIMGQLRSGTLIALGVTTKKRVPALPDVPTVAEACNLPGWDSTTWYALFAPAGTPQPILDRMNNEINKILRDPAFDKKVQDLGLVSLPSTLAEFKEIHKQDIDRWHERVLKSGARID